MNFNGTAGFMRRYECKINDESSLSMIREMNILFGLWLHKLFVLLYVNPVEDKNELKRNFQRDMGEFHPPITTPLKTKWTQFRAQGKS